MLEKAQSLNLTKIESGAMRRTQGKIKKAADTAVSLGSVQKVGKEKTTQKTSKSNKI